MWIGHGFNVKNDIAMSNNLSRCKLRKNDNDPASRSSSSDPASGVRKCVNIAGVEKMVFKVLVFYGF